MFSYSSDNVRSNEVLRDKGHPNLKKKFKEVKKVYGVSRNHNYTLDQSVDEPGEHFDLT